MISREGVNFSGASCHLSKFPFLALSLSSCILYYLQQLSLLPNILYQVLTQNSPWFSKDCVAFMRNRLKILRILGQVQCRNKKNLYFSIRIHSSEGANHFSSQIISYWLLDLRTQPAKFLRIILTFSLKSILRFSSHSFCLHSFIKYLLGTDLYQTLSQVLRMQKAPKTKYMPFQSSGSSGERKKKEINISTLYISYEENKLETKRISEKGWVGVGW